MSKHFRLVPAVLAALVAVVAVPAPAAVAAPRSAVVVQQGGFAARSFSRGFGRSVYRTQPSSRYRSPYTRSYRRSPFHGFGGTVLKALGISYLFHALFGWGGGGGSPFGLLILVALVFWLVGRGRRPSYTRRF